MSGLLNKIPDFIKELAIVAACVIVGIFVFKQEEFEFVFGLMDGFLSYLSIMSSVSLAIVAVLTQRFDKKSLEVNDAAKIRDEVLDIAKKMDIEVWRIVFMLLPVFAYFVMSFFGGQNRFGASLLASITFMAIIFSIVLPIKYVNIIKSQMVRVVEKREDEEKERSLKTADELLKKIKSDK